MPPAGSVRFKALIYAIVRSTLSRKDSRPTSKSGSIAKARFPQFWLSRSPGKHPPVSALAKSSTNQREPRTFGATIESHQSAGHENFLRVLGWDAFSVIADVWGQYLAFNQSLHNLENRHRGGGHVQNYRFAAGGNPNRDRIAPESAFAAPARRNHLA